MRMRDAIVTASGPGEDYREEREGIKRRVSGQYQDQGEKRIMISIRMKREDQDDQDYMMKGRREMTRRRREEMLIRLELLHQ